MRDVWSKVPIHLSVVVRLLYDVLSTAAILVTWGMANAFCHLCQVKQILEHVMSTCKVVLGRGSFTWCHNKVHSELSTIVDVARTQVNKRTSTKQIYFLRAGQNARGKINYSMSFVIFLQ